MLLYYAKPDAYSYYEEPYAYAARPQPAIYSMYDPAYLRAAAEEESIRKFLAEQVRRRQEEEARQRFEAAMQIARERARQHAQAQRQAQTQARSRRPQNIFDSFGMPFGRPYVPYQDKVDREEGECALPGSIPSRPGTGNSQGQRSVAGQGQSQGPTTSMYADKATQVPVTRKESTPRSKPTSQTSGFSIPVTTPGDVSETVTAAAAAAADSPTPGPTEQEDTTDNAERNSMHSSALTEIANLTSRFAALHDNFTMPSSLDFESEPTAANDVTRVNDERPRLAYTSRSAPVHAYEDQLMRLLQAVDSIDSNGDLEVRSARRMLVREIEAALSKIDAEVRRMWDECVRAIKGQDAEMDVANDEKTGMVLDDELPSVSTETSSMDVEAERTTSAVVAAATQKDSTLDPTRAVPIEADDSAVSIEVDYAALRLSSVGTEETEFSADADTTGIPTATSAPEFESTIVVVDSVAPPQDKEPDIECDRDVAEAGMFNPTTAADLDMKVEDPGPSTRSSSSPLNLVSVEEEGVAPQSPRLSVSLPRSSTPRSASPSQLSVSLEQEEEDSVLPRKRARSDNGGGDGDAGISANEKKEDENRDEREEETKEAGWYDAMKDGLDTEDKEMVVVDGRELTSDSSPSPSESSSSDVVFMPSSDARSNADSRAQGQNTDDKESSSLGVDADEDADADADTLSLISNVALPVLAQEACSTIPSVPAQAHSSEVEYVMV